MAVKKVSEQMEMFEDGGLKDEGGTTDPVSGNDVPPGSTQEEVRDDIPAQLSEGEFVFPADVTRFIGLEKLMMMRQEAKMGLKKMEDMGQMGNSEEATMSDDMPFNLTDIETDDDTPFSLEDLEMEDDSKEMADGGYVMVEGKPMPIPMIGGQLPPITTRPMPETKNMAVGGLTNTTGTYQVPTNIATQPSYFQNYKQSTAPFRPFVQQNTGVQPPNVPNVVGQVPTFEELMPQLTGKRETIEYRNDAGQKLFIPFINDKPIYPIPEGYTRYTAEKEVTPEKQPTVQSTSVRQDSSDGGDDNVLSQTNQVRGIDNSIINTNFTDASPEGIKDSFGKMTESQRGLTVINSMESARGSNAFMKNLATGMFSLAGGPLGTAVGAYDTISKLGGGQGLNIGASQPDALNNITNAFGYNIDNFSDAYGYVDDITTETTQKLNSLSLAVYGLNYKDATTKLGAAPTFTKGYKNGQIDPTTGGTYSNGQVTNDDGTVSYGSLSDAGSGFTAMSKSGFMGGLKDAERVASKASASLKDKARARTYIDVYYAEQEDPEKSDDKQEEKSVTGKGTVSPGTIDLGYEDDREDEQQSDDNPSDVGDSIDTESDYSDSSGGGYTDSAGVGVGAKGGFFTKSKMTKQKPKKMKRGGLASRK